MRALFVAALVGSVLLSDASLAAQSDPFAVDLQVRSWAPLENEFDDVRWEVPAQTWWRVYAADYEHSEVHVRCGREEHRDRGRGGWEWSSAPFRGECSVVVGSGANARRLTVRLRGHEHEVEVHTGRVRTRSVSRDVLAMQCIDGDHRTCRVETHRPYLVLPLRDDRTFEVRLEERPRPDRWYLSPLFEFLCFYGMPPVVPRAIGPGESIPVVVLPYRPQLPSELVGEGASVRVVATLPVRTVAGDGVTQMDDVIAWSDVVR